jgi:hypothetical protein
MNGRVGDGEGSPAPPKFATRPKRSPQRRGSESISVGIGIDFYKIGAWQCQQFSSSWGLSLGCSGWRIDGKIPQNKRDLSKKFFIKTLATIPAGACDQIAWRSYETVG